MESMKPKWTYYSYIFWYVARPKNTHLTVISHYILTSEHMVYGIRYTIYNIELADRSVGWLLEWMVGSLVGQWINDDNYWKLLMQLPSFFLFEWHSLLRPTIKYQNCMLSILNSIIIGNLATCIENMGTEKKKAIRTAYWIYWQVDMKHFIIIWSLNNRFFHSMKYNFNKLRTEDSRPEKKNDKFVWLSLLNFQLHG